MTYRAKDSRVYPYNTGLKLGSELDVVLTNENGEPVDRYDLFGEDGKSIIEVDSSGGEETQGGSVGHNHFKYRNGMVRMFSMQSYCRGYATDNIWYMLKYLIKHVKKKAFLSSVSSINGNDIDRMSNDEIFTAAGHLKFSVLNSDSVYSAERRHELYKMTYNYDDESHMRLLNNIRLIIGIVALLLDRREAAEYRRKEYGPFSTSEFRKTDSAITYQTPTNFWLYSPMLAHLMLGLCRFSYFLTQNNFELEVWEGFEPEDIKNAIHNSDYEVGLEIWRLIKARVREAGYSPANNPFGKKPAAILEMLFQYGVGTLGDSVYTNWQMTRMLSNFQGHFDDLPSWENGATDKVFVKEHPMFNVVTEYLEAPDVE